MDRNSTELCCPLYQCGESWLDVAPWPKGLQGHLCAIAPLHKVFTPRPMILLPCPSLHYTFIPKALDMPFRK